MRNMASIVASAAVAGLALLARPASLRAVQATGPATSVATAPSTVPAGASALSARVASVKGVVQFRDAEDKPWQNAAVGATLGQGAEIRTGLRSAVQLVIEPDQLITLDRLGTVKLLQVFQDRGKVTTDLGVKYGRARYDIQATDLQHQSTIRSPGSTLAIRGTDVTYEDQVPWVPSAASRNGRAEFRNFRREALAFGGAKRAVVAADKTSAAQQALAHTKVDPRSAFAGRTGAEDDLLLGLPAAGGTDARGIQAVQALARVGGFQGSFVGVPDVPGPLQFQLDWITTSQKPANVDFLVTDPRGNVASAINPIVGRGSATGEHGGDDLGASGAGAEGVVWGLFFPAGRYKVQAVHRGGEPAQIFITTTQGDRGDPIKTFGVDPEPAIILQPGETYEGTVRTRPGGGGGGSRGAALVVSPAANKPDRASQAAQKAQDVPRAPAVPAARAGARGR